MPLIPFPAASKSLRESFPELFSSVHDELDFFSKRFLREGIDSEALLQLKDFVRVISGLNIPNSNGYSIAFSEGFKWRGDAGVRIGFPGLFLKLKNPAGKTVGALGFTLGFPLEICMVQGIKGNHAREFFKATGKHFDEALIDSFLKIAGNCIKIKRKAIPLPKVIFSNLFFDSRMSGEMRKRIIKKYCSSRPAFRMLEELTRLHLNDRVKALRKLEPMPSSPFRVRGNTLARLKKKPL